MKALALTLALTCSLPAFASAGNLPFDDVGFLPKQARVTKADDTASKSEEGLSRIAYMKAELQDEADDIASTEAQALDDLRIRMMQTEVFAMTTTVTVAAK